MATERIKKIMPAGQGGDYTSLASWEAAEQADLVTLDEIRIAEIDGIWSNPETSTVTIDGWTTSINNRIIIRAVGVAAATSTWSNSKFIIDGTGNIGIYNFELHLDIKNIQFRKGSNNNYNCFHMQSLTGIDIGLYNNYFMATTTFTTDPFAFSVYNCSGTLKVINCIASGFISSISTSAFSINTGTATAYIYNCIVYNCGNGFRQGGSTVVIAKNCLARSCTDGFNGSFNAASTNNCSDIASDAPGTNPVTGSVTFIDAANGDFRLSPYDTVAQFAGANLYADANYPVTTDIAGTSRGDATAANYDIGAHHPTTSIRTIKPSGGNYTSLAAWESGQQRDLVTHNKIAIGEIDGDWISITDNSNVWIDGWTTDSTRCIIIRAIGTARHTGRWDSTKYILAPSSVGLSTPNLGILESYVSIYGLQTLVNQNVGSGGYWAIGFLTSYSENPTSILFDSCIAKTTGALGVPDYSAGFWLNAHSSVVQRVINCIAFGFDATVNESSGIHLTEGIGYNCTVYDCALGFHAASPGIVKNCLVQSCINDFGGSYYGLSANNCSDIGAGTPGSNPVTGTVQFVDAVNGDFHLSPSDTTARKRGVSLDNDATYPFNTDIDGKLRIGPWDIGADQFEIVKVLRANKLYGVNKLRIT